MKLITFLTAAAVAAAVLAAPLHAQRFTARSLSDSHLGNSTTELVAQRDFSQHLIVRLSRSWKFAPRRRDCWAHVPWSRLCDRTRRAVFLQRHLLALALARLAEQAPAFPPHHALWMCIHGHEASDWHNRDTGGNGHFGGLQMHPGWGYGTSQYASDDSQMTQEWAAERGYQASGYSQAWLLGQWDHPDCLRFA